MGTITANQLGPTNEGLIEVLWEALTTTNRVGNGILLAKSPDKTVQVLGNFSGSASVAIEGSNDDGTTWFSCKDITGTVLAFTVAGGDLILENPKLIRPNLTVGDGSADIDVFLVAVAR